MVFSVVLIIILTIFSAFFSMSETSFTSLNRVQMQTQANNGDKRAKLVLALASSYDKLISTILIGNNIVNIASSTIAATVFTILNPKYGALISTIVMTLVILVFGEITPKTIAKNNASSIAKATSPILRVFTIILRPIVVLMNLITNSLAKLFDSGDTSVITDEELLFIIGEAEESGSLSNYEHELITSAIKIDDIKVEEVLKPRPDIFAIDINLDLEEIKAKFYASQFSRVLIYDGNIDRVLGIVHEKDFSRFLLGMDKKETFRDLIADVLIIYPWQRVTLVLNEMQNSRKHFAVVKGEYGETLGILTLEDILEELVGNIWDEKDEKFETMERNEDGSYTIVGTVYAKYVFDYFNIEGVAPHRSKTIGGFLVERLGKYASKGDFVEYQGFKLLAEEVKNGRVIRLKLITPEENNEEI